MESSVVDSVEVSYCEMKDFKKRVYEERFENADKIFVASLYFTEDDVRDIEILAMAFGHKLDDVIVVGDNNFGETMTQVYCRRFREDYYQTCIKMKDGFMERNEHFKIIDDKRYLDLISMVSNSTGKVRVFTDDKLFISSDCGHLTRAGARYFAKHIDFSVFL